jgi:hypothetical protein
MRRWLSAIAPDLDAAERGGQLSWRAGEQDQVGFGVGQPERDGAADARAAPVISVVLPVKSVATAVFLSVVSLVTMGEAPPSVRENKGHIPNGRRLTASARILTSRICMNAPRQYGISRICGHGGNPDS